MDLGFAEENRREAHYLKNGERGEPI